MFPHDENISRILQEVERLCDHDNGFDFISKSYTMSFV